MSRARQLGMLTYRGRDELDSRFGKLAPGLDRPPVAEYLDHHGRRFAERYGVRFRVSRIAVRDLTKDRGPRAAGIPISDQALELVSDPEVDVVVEVAGGTSVEPILRAALAAGKPVVTANKALLASKLADLGVLAQRTETPLYCEAAAAAAIPIVRHLSHRADEVDSMWGIVNATCNFVMTRLEQGDLTLAEAVSEAQKLGFAEAQPDADLDGHDAAAKLSILAYRAFGAWVRPDGFLVRGIREIDPADCDLAESMGCRIRQIARAVRINGALDMAVEPLLLPTWHLLASVEEEYNAVYLRCASSGDLSLFGKGAGALPTATAVLGDLIDLAQDNSVRWPVPRALPVAREGAAISPAPRRHYLRITAQPHPGLERKFEGLVRRHGLTVQNRASRAEADRVHLAFMISASSDTQIAAVTDAVGRLARVEQRLCLGVMD